MRSLFCASVCCALFSISSVTAQMQWQRDAEGWPVPRTPGAFVFDAARSAAILVGGSSRLVSGSLSDTWERKGVHWRKHSAVAVPAIFSAGVYDSKRQRILAFGFSRAGLEGWQWDGMDWSLLGIGRTVPHYLDFAVVYDSSRDRVVLFSHDETWEWNGSTWSQRFPNTIPPARRDMSMSYDSARQRVVMFGGHGTTALLGDTWEWDGVDWARIATAHSPSPRFYHEMTFDSVRGRTVLYGGSVITARKKETWEYDGQDWVEIKTNHSPDPVYLGAMTFDSVRQRVVLFGGHSTLEDGIVWEWDGVAWVSFDPPGPVARQGFAAAWDRSRNRGVIFGGTDYNRALQYQDTWEWDGSSWRARSPSTVPTGRRHAAMAYDAGRGVSLMFGGWPTPHDTWEWDGSDWTRLAPSTVPADRFRHAMACDADRRRVVMFGGNNHWPSSPRDLDDTWEWDGTNWQQQTPVHSPSARRSHAMAYDAARGRVVLFGGMSGAGPFRYLNDTWEYNGTNWTKRTPLRAPKERAEHVLVYDEQRQRVVLYGGSNSTIGFVGAMDDVWEWDGQEWIAQTAGMDKRRGHGAFYDDVANKVVVVAGEGVVGGISEIRSDVLTYSPTVRGEATPFGNGCSGAAGVPAIVANGPVITGNRDLEIGIDSARPNAPIAIWVGLTPGTVSLGSCTLYTPPPVIALPGASDAKGMARVSVPVPFDAALSGSVLWMQGVVADPNGAFRGIAAFTSGLRLVVGD